MDPDEILAEAERKFEPFANIETLESEIRKLVMFFAPGEWTLNDASNATVKLLNIFTAKNAVDLNRELGV